MPWEGIHDTCVLPAGTKFSQLLYGDWTRWNNLKPFDNGNKVQSIFTCHWYSMNNSIFSHISTPNGKQELLICVKMKLAAVILHGVERTSANGMILLPRINI